MCQNILKHLLIDYSKYLGHIARPPETDVDYITRRTRRMYHRDVCCYLSFRQMRTQFGTLRYITVSSVRQNLALFRGFTFDLENGERFSTALLSCMTLFYINLRKTSLDGAVIKSLADRHWVRLSLLVSTQSDFFTSSLFLTVNITANPLSWTDSTDG